MLRKCMFQTFVQSNFRARHLSNRFLPRTFVQWHFQARHLSKTLTFVPTHFRVGHLSRRIFTPDICPQDDICHLSAETLEIVWPARTLSGSRTFVRGRSYQFPCRRDPLFRNQGNHRESGDFPVDGSFAVSTVGREPELDLTTDTDTTSTERIIYAINNWLSDTFHKRLFTKYLCQLADFD